MKKSSKIHFYEEKLRTKHQREVYLLSRVSQSRLFYSFFFVLSFHFSINTFLFNLVVFQYAPPTHYVHRLRKLSTKLIIFPSIFRTRFNIFSIKPYDILDVILICNLQAILDIISKSISTCFLSILKSRIPRLIIRKNLYILLIIN